MIDPDDDSSRSKKSSRGAQLAIPGVLIALLIILGWLALRQLSTLGDRIGELTGQVDELADDVAEAEQHSAQSEHRADLAEQEADEAEKDAASSRAAAQAATKEAEISEQEARAALAEREAAVAKLALAEEVALEALAEVDETEAELQRAEEEAEAARTEARRAWAEAAEIRRQRELELDLLQQTLDKIVETRRTALGMVMNLGSDRVEFDVDKAELRAENRELLSRIVGVLLTAGSFEIQVFGHTDDVGSQSYNQKLSEQRAAAVRDYMVEAGLDADIITVRGFGKEKPLVQGTDPASRQRNRRVEIGLIQTDLEFSPMPVEDEP